MAGEVAVDDVGRVGMRIEVHDPDVAVAVGVSHGGRGFGTTFDGERAAIRQGLGAPAACMRRRTVHMGSVPEIRLVMCDVGGVVLTNGWDTDARRKVIDGLDLDWDEFDERHQFIVDSFETGAIGLEHYIRFTVMHRPRDFGLAVFAALMRAQSAPQPGGLELAGDLAACPIRCVTVNNESRPLNDHRIATFGLDRLFDGFFTSGYLGVKKPHGAIYRMVLEVMATQPRHCVFIDDRAMNLEPAASLGVHTIHHSGAANTRRALSDLGIELASPSKAHDGPP